MFEKTDKGRQLGEIIMTGSGSIEGNVGLRELRRRRDAAALQLQMKKDLRYDENSIQMYQDVLNHLEKRVKDAESI